MGPHVVCWCGFENVRGDGTNPYLCRPLADAKEDDILRISFAACGFDPNRSRGEIGIYSPEYYRMATERQAKIEAEKNHAVPK